MKGENPNGSNPEEGEPEEGLPEPTPARGKHRAPRSPCIARSR